MDESVIHKKSTHFLAEMNAERVGDDLLPAFRWRLPEDVDGRATDRHGANVLGCFDRHDNCPEQDAEGRAGRSAGSWWNVGEGCCAPAITHDHDPSKEESPNGWSAQMNEWKPNNQDTTTNELS